MKYVIFGAGALGCVLGGYMTRAGKDVTLIARGENLRVLREKGLILQTPTQGTTQEKPMTIPVEGDLHINIKVLAEEDYSEQPDVVILTTKAYSLDSVYPFLERVCTENTVVLPLQNAIGIGKTIDDGMEKKAQVLEGDAYIACERKAPGEVRHKLDFFRIVYGMQVGQSPIPELELIKQDLIDCGCNPEISNDMLKSDLTKFVRVASGSAAQVYYGGTTGDIVADPEKFAFLEELAREIVQLADAAGCPLDDDPIGDVLAMSRSIFPEYRTSLKTDLDAGRPTEFKYQIEALYELGKKYGLEMKAYEKVVRKFEEMNKVS
jgi:2-dehydropantoate 2-reductase